MCVMDYATIACGDKFGNIFVLRLPDHANDEMQVTSGNLWDQGVLNGAPNKLEVINHFYLGELPTGITKTAMKFHGKEVLIISTVLGGLYAFVPAKSKDEAGLFQHLEMFLRQEYTNLCHRDHLSFRSYFTPVKSVIDVTLCERYMQS